MTGSYCLKLNLVVLLATWVQGAPTFAQPDRQLDILDNVYPRAFFFRATEQAFNARRYPTYEDWESQFNRLQGIMGKCLDEECLGREARNPEFFTRFKKQHPNQVVLLHFNGNARDPRYHTEPYFAGHWIYRRAVTITGDVPAEPGESVIHVDDARAFRINMGRYRTSNDDVALFAVDQDGRHDWYHCEQVQLLDVDVPGKTIRVKRGCYGTRPLAFRAGRARAAAHQVEGPWGRNNHIMWYYNFSAQCPRDRQGRTCGDLLVEDLARWFGSGGKLAAFDGLEFDVMFNQTHGDTDGDGVEDDGVIDGVNQYGIGVVQFARRLRQRMGPDFIIQGDGALGRGGARSQRAWKILNGIESEGWPNLTDWEIEDWSGGLNRHRFWQQNAHPPAFSYVNHKWNQPVPGQPGARQRPDVPFARHRLVLAACQFMDAATCYSLAPPRDPDGTFGIWDELRCGAEHRLGWLGRPDGPAVQLALRQPDLLEGAGQTADLVKRISGPVGAVATGDGLRVTTQDPTQESIRFAIESVPTNGTDLVVAVTMTAAARPGYPEEMARFAQVGVSGGMVNLMAGEPLQTGMKLRGARREVPLDPTAGASVRRQKRTIAGTTLPAYFVHPPYETTRGYTFWTQEAAVGKDDELRFSIGMGEKSPDRSDGVWFRVEAAAVEDGTIGPYRQIFEADTNEHRWLPQAVSLKPFAGKRVRFKFVADCGPDDNATTDHAHWGGVRLVDARQGDNHITKSKQFMTWVNPEPFTSTFYFDHIRSERVRLSVNVEGIAPVTIRSVTVHASPDVMYRAFERGLVLANPARRPYTFDLNRITPARSYRRLQATARQDTQTNDGQPVGDRVTLGERDGLFLQCVE